jgi:putative ABC transport system permease protein
VRAVRPLLPETLEVNDSAKQAEEASKELDEGMAYIRYFLLGFGAIALFVGAFVIFNTLSITVAQRTREFATLRTLGASRKQVLRSVRIEGFAIGLLASVIGLLLGLGVAKGMLALFSAMGVDLPDGGTVFGLKTVIVSLLVGTGVTLLATVLPARRATRIPPIAAVREGSALPASRFSTHSGKAGLAVVAVAFGAIVAGAFAGGLSAAAMGLLLGVGVLTLFGGIAMLAPRLVGPLARVVGWPARRAGGVAGELAGANSVRNPGRTASTAAALMIGLTLVTVVAVLGSGMSKSTESAVTDQLRAGYVVDGNNELPFAAAEGEALAKVPGVIAASHVRSDKALVGGTEMDVTGVDPATIGEFYRFAWEPGSERALGRLGSDGALVTKAYAEDEGLAMGGRLALQTPSG